MNIHSVTTHLDIGPPTIILTNASSSAWGIDNRTTENGGRWNEVEKARVEWNEINYLEFWAAFMAV